MQQSLFESEATPQRDDPWRNTPVIALALAAIALLVAVGVLGALLAR
jgi:hypothetical protein